MNENLINLTEGTGWFIFYMAFGDKVIEQKPGSGQVREKGYGIFNSVVPNFTGNIGNR
jgi:hypothetical protein